MVFASLCLEVRRISSHATFQQVVQPLLVRKPSLMLCILFIGPESDHWLCLSLTDSLTDSCLVNLIDETLACENAYSKLVEAEYCC